MNTGTWVPDRHDFWMDFFPHSAIHRGQKYHRQHRIRDIEVQDQEEGRCRVISAQVQGSDFRPYHVTVLIRSDEKEGLTIESECSCPMEYECKHGAAVIFAALEEQPRLFDFSLTVRSETKLLPETQIWLEQLDKAAAPVPTDPNAYPPDEPQRLLYTLDVVSQHGPACVAVKAMTARVKKTGGWSDARAYNLGNIVAGHPPARFIRPVDLKIARKLQLIHGHFVSGAHGMGGVEGAELLQEMLATGRCYWRGCGKHHPPLTLGEARSGQLAWATDATGMQRPSLQATPSVTAVLPLAPPWYVDETNATCGPIETGLPPNIAEAWIVAPGLPPEQVPLLTEELTRRYPGLSLPAPQPIVIEDARDVKPAPCLRLFAVPLKPYEMYYFGGSSNRKPNLTDMNLGHLAFDYGGRCIEADDPENVIDSYADGKLRRVPRDLKAERKALARLTQFGFKSASSMFAYYGQHAQELTLRDEKTWLEFTAHLLPKLRAEGWRVEIDPSFSFNFVTAEEWFAEVQEGSGLDWFGINLGVQVQGQRIDLLPVLVQLVQTRPDLLNSEALAKMKDKATVPVRLPDGRILPFPAARLRSILGVLVELLDPKALGADGLLQLPKLQAAELAGLGEGHWNWLGNAELQALGRRLRDFRGLQPVAPSPRLTATLRGYQQEGLNWLQFLREFNLAGILADDMGLGKTVEALAHLLIEKESGRMDRPSLVVAPTSLMTNWRQETERFAPGLKLLVLHGGGRKAHFDKLADYDLIVTSYPLLPRDQAVLLAQEFHCVILDEAQYIKNPKTQWAQVVTQLKARHRLCMTGTPMENHLGELWSQFHFLMPGFLGDEKRFRLLFRSPIEKQKSETRRTVLAKRIAPFVLRRRKEEVALELPPKTEIVHNVELEGAQRDLYESIRLAMHARVKAEIDQKGISRAHIIILDALLKLRQVCCDPRLLKLDQARKVEESAKLALLLDLLPEMIEEGRRVLLFSQFTSMLALIELELGKLGLRHVKLTGETTDRATPVAQFQSGKVPLFLISLKAEGTGLNLTAADTVIHYDPWWNPAVENQATDRAHRIGQDKKVFVYKLMTVGTVEEKIAVLQQRKRELVDGLLNERAKFPALTPEDLDVLFEPLR